MAGTSKNVTVRREAEHHRPVVVVDQRENYNWTFRQIPAQDETQTGGANESGGINLVITDVSGQTVGQELTLETTAVQGHSRNQVSTL